MKKSLLSTLAGLVIMIGAQAYAQVCSDFSGTYNGTDSFVAPSSTPSSAKVVITQTGCHQITITYTDIDSDIFGPDTETYPIGYTYVVPEPVSGEPGSAPNGNGGFTQTGSFNGAVLTITSQGYAENLGDGGPPYFSEIYTISKNAAGKLQITLNLNDIDTEIFQAD